MYPNCFENTTDCQSVNDDQEDDEVAVIPDEIDDEEYSDGELDDKLQAVRKSGLGGAKASDRQS